MHGGSGNAIRLTTDRLSGCGMNLLTYFSVTQVPKSETADTRNINLYKKLKIVKIRAVYAELRAQYGMLCSSQNLS